MSITNLSGGLPGENMLLRGGHALIIAQDLMPVLLTLIFPTGGEE